jgi:hypothetical protein
VVNSIEISSSKGTYTVEGDVTNAGLEEAKSIVVTVGNPATAVDPTKVYVIGSLEPDDFSTFEVTFTAQGSSTIPLQIRYKDGDGNSYEMTEQITLNSGEQSEAASTSGDQQTAMGPSGAGGMGGMGGPGGAGLFGVSGGGLGAIPVIPIVFVVTAGVALAVLWRKGVLGKIRARIRR